MRSTEQDGRKLREQLGGFVRRQKTVSRRLGTTFSTDCRGQDSTGTAGVIRHNAIQPRADAAETPSFSILSGPRQDRPGRSGRHVCLPIRHHLRQPGPYANVPSQGGSSGIILEEGVLAVTAWGIFPSKSHFGSCKADLTWPDPTRPRPGSPPPLPFSNFCRPIFPGVSNRQRPFPRESTSLQPRYISYFARCRHTL